jgi:hypothetical protein
MFSPMRVAVFIGAEIARENVVVWFLVYRLGDFTKVKVFESLGVFVYRRELVETARGQRFEQVG